MRCSNSHSKRSKEDMFRCFPANGLLLLLLWFAAFPRIAVHAQEQPQGGAPAQGTMEDVLQASIQAFSQRNYAQAAQLFTQLDSTFGREPEYNEDKFQKVLLPAWGFAAYQTGETQTAIEKFQTFLDNYPDARRGRDFALYTLAQAYAKAGQSSDAAEKYRLFREEFPNRPETGLAWLEESKMLFDQGENQAAYTNLQQLYEDSNIPNRLRIQGRLLSLQRSTQNKDYEQAVSVLLNTPWSVDVMPELAVLAFSSLKIGDHLMDQKRYADALLAYRLVPPRDTLIKIQQRRLNELEREARRVLRNSRNNPNISFWKDYYDSLLGKIKGQLKGLKESEDYTPGFMLRFGQAYLLKKRLEEAWIVFETLTLETEYPKNIRREAQYRWIVTTHTMEDWDNALAIARDFVDRYPDSKLAPRALYMIAKAYQELREYENAIGVLTDLIDGYPDHKLAPRWHFVRGFNHVLMDDNLSAREDFGSYLDLKPKGIIHLQARLWYSLTYHFEGEYKNALSLVNQFLPMTDGRPIEPEVQYRRATMLYALKRYDQALSALNDFLQNHSRHRRAPEATVLRGDVLMGKGKLEKAIAAFKSVGPEAQSLFPYAVFQIGKIYKARAGAWETEHPEQSREQYRLMIEHFQNYIERDDIPEKQRVSEALYKMGKAYEQLGDIQKAFPLFFDALKNYGNDPQESQILQILQALQKLHKAYWRGESNQDVAAQNELLNTKDFMDWIAQQKEVAMQEERYTYYGRLGLFQNKVFKNQDKQNQAKEALFDLWENIPIEAMDALTLGKVGLIVLEELDSPLNARDYLERLLEEYPSAYARAYAFYGMGRIHFDEYKKHLSKDEKVVAEKALDESRRLLSRFRQEMPVHPLHVDVTILYSRVLVASETYEKAHGILQELLRMKQARGRPHARALLQLSQLEEARGDLKKAVAFAQRIYTLYRAYPELLAKSYYRNGQLFEEIDKPGVAYRTYKEMLDDERLNIFPEYVKAEKAFKRLDESLPEEVKNPPEKEEESEENDEKDVDQEKKDAKDSAEQAGSQPADEFGNQTSAVRTPQWGVFQALGSRMIDERRHA